MITHKVWQALTDTLEEDAIASYVERAGKRHLGQPLPARSPVPTRRQEGAATGKHARSPASSFRMRWVMGWALVVGALLYLLLRVVLRA